MQNLILLVEDDPTLRLLASKQFEILKLLTDVAVNGVEALTKAPDGYALILMDLGLPQMDGFEAAGLIREGEQRRGIKHTPIIAMTAYSDRQKALDAGMDDYLQKPVLIEPLKEMIQRWAPQLFSINRNE